MKVEDQELLTKLLAQVFQEDITTAMNLASQTLVKAASDFGAGIVQLKGSGDDDSYVWGVFCTIGHENTKEFADKAAEIEREEEAINLLNKKD